MTIEIKGHRLTLDPTASEYIKAKRPDIVFDYATQKMLSEREVINPLPEEDQEETR